MKILIDEKSLQARISEIALEIDSYYQKQDWYRKTQEPVVVIGVLSGAIFFMTDLVRKLAIRVELDFIKVSTYPDKTTIAQESNIITLPTKSLRNAHILLVDDILDTGKTIKMVRWYLAQRCFNNIQVAVLLRKSGKVHKDIEADFVGFDIPNKFVVGFGLDFDGRYRELPYIAMLGSDLVLE